MRVRDGGGTPRVRRTVLSGRGACTGGSSGTVASVPSPALMGAAPPGWVLDEGGVSQGGGGGAGKRREGPPGKRGKQS